MDLTPAQAASAVERLDCPTCGVPAGTPCRTRSGTTAIKYHTPRFLLVKALRDEQEVDVPADRGPGRPWRAGPTRLPIRIGYAYSSTAAHDLDDQLDALTAAHCRQVFAEQVSTRTKARPELAKALTLAADLAQNAQVVLTVRELRRLARNAAELITLSVTLRTADIRLELLTGPLAGIHDPNATGPTLFAVLAAAADLDRDHVREKTHEAQQAAAARGHPGGRPRVFDEDMLAIARALSDQGVPVPEIAARLTIRTGKNAGRPPSVASVYRALAEPDTQERSREPHSLRTAP